MQVAERGRTVVSTNALVPPEAPYELINRASRVYNLSRGNAKIGNRGAMIRAMSDSKHMDACRSDTPFDGDYDATNSNNTCCSSADHRAKYFHGLKIAPRPPTRRPREEGANCASEERFRANFLPADTFDRCVPGRAAGRSPRSPLSNEGNDRAWRAIDT